MEPEKVLFWIEIPEYSIIRSNKNHEIAKKIIKAIFDRFEIDNKRAWKGYDKEIGNYNKLILYETIDKENRYLRYSNSTAKNDLNDSDRISIEQFYDLYVTKNKRIKLTF